MHTPNIHPLPTELILAIFELVLVSSIDYAEDSDYRDNDNCQASYDSWPDIFELKKGPWILGRVCTRWRSIVLSIPKLWSKFCVGHWYGKQESAVELLRVWLSRTGDLPLQCQIALTPGFCLYNSVPTLFLALVATSNRWQTLALVDVSIDILNALAREQKTRLNSLFPRLKQLALLSRNYLENELEDPVDFDKFSPAASVFSHAENLDTVVNLNGSTVSTFQLPWNQLTTYVGSYASSADHWKVMLLCPNLVECDVIFNCPRRVWHDVRPPTLSRLRKWTIRICNSSDDVICAFLSRIAIQVPNLQELILLAGSYTFTSSLNLFRSILHSSNCSLQYLELSGWAEQTSISQFLGTVGTITRLRIWVKNFVILPLLCLDPSQEALVPLLDTLEFVFTEWADIFDLDIPLLAAVVRSRLASDCVQSIRRLNIVMSTLEMEVTDPQVLPPIMEVLQEEGLQIRISNK